MPTIAKTITIKTPEFSYEDGIIKDYAALVKALNEIGYDDWVSAEMIPNYTHYTETIIYNTSNAMDKILGRK